MKNQKQGNEIIRRWLILTLFLMSLVLPISALAQGGMGPGPGVGRSAATPTPTPDFVTDTFTETSDTELSLHTGELGATWTEHPAAVYGTSSVNGSLDAVYAANDPSAYYTSGVPPSANYCVEAVVNHVSTISANAAIVARFDTTANTGYLFQFNNGTGWRVRKIVAGTQTTLGTEDTTTNIPSVGQSRTMKLCTIGTTISAYVDGSLLGSPGGTDSAISGAGRAGVRFAGTFSSSSGYHFSSFRAFTP